MSITGTTPQWQQNRLASGGDVQLLLIGIHQRTASVSVREQLAFEPSALQPALQALGRVAHEGFIISTCNRVEIGGLFDDQATAETLVGFLAGWHGVPFDELLPHIYALSGEDVVRHVFRLASGLDSMVLGEEQIMGQIKRALTAAHDAGVLGNALHRLLEHGLCVGKMVRTETGISRSHLSVVSVAVDLARQHMGGLAGRRFLVIGAGRMGELALKHIHSEFPQSVGVISRTDAKAQVLAERYGVNAWNTSDLLQAMCESDVVLSCTSAPGLVITSELAALASAGRSEPLLLLDLAVPRDIDPLVADLPNVQLFDVDGMQAICNANRAARAAEITAAETLVEREVRRFMEWWVAQQVTPTIKALCERAEAIRDAELQRAFARLPDLSPREQAAIQALSAAIVNKLLHQPIATLKDPDVGGTLARSVQMLFQLPEMQRESHATEC